MFGIEKYVLRDIATGKTYPARDGHEAAKIVREHGGYGRMEDAVGGAFEAMQALGYDRNGTHGSTGGLFDNLFDLNEPSVSVPDEDKSFIDYLFNL